MQFSTKKYYFIFRPFCWTTKKWTIKKTISIFALQKNIWNFRNLFSFQKQTNIFCCLEHDFYARGVGQNTPFRCKKYNYYICIRACPKQSINSKFYDIEDIHLKYEFRSLTTILVFRRSSNFWPKFWFFDQDFVWFVKWNFCF